MDAASPKIDAALSGGGSSLRNRLDIKASSEESNQIKRSQGFRIEDRVEIGQERLPFKKARGMPGSPLKGFFERAKRRLESFLDASKEAKEARTAEEADGEARSTRLTPEAKEAQAAPEAQEDKRSSLQALFKKREAEDAYGLNP